MTSQGSSGFHVADYVLFVLFLVSSTAIGLYHAFAGAKHRTTTDYLVAGRRLHTIPVAISIVVSIVSGILVLGHPAEVYTRGAQFTMRTLGHVVACVIASVTIVPLFFGLQVTSSFEYLERRYRSKGVKLIGSISMLVSTMIQSGVVLYAPAVALEAVTGLPVWCSVLGTSTISILYTSLGGMKAVIWTDVFQAICMIGGMIAIIISGTIKIGGLAQMWNIGRQGGRLELFDFNPDPTVRVTFWSVFFGGISNAFVMFGVGQTTVQRYCALPTLRQAQWSLYINAFLMVFIYVLATLVGLVIYAYYTNLECDPLKMKYITSANQLVPYFVMNVLNFPGLPGAFLAVLFGGALSTMSSTLNSSSAVTWEDILKYLCGARLTDAQKTLVTKLLVIIYGVIATCLAFAAKYMGSHVLQTITTIMGTFYGPTLGLFLLGAIFPFANAKGAVVGCVLATAFNVWISIGSFIYDPHRQTLPVSIQGCNVSYSTSYNESQFTDVYNMSHSLYETIPDLNASDYTVVTSSSAEPAIAASGLMWLYSISFNLYPVIGFTNTILIGILVSLMTGPDNMKNADPRLIIPVFDRLCCCLPLRLRKRLRCRVNYDHEENDDTLTVDNIKNDVRRTSNIYKLKDIENKDNLTTNDCAVNLIKKEPLKD